MLHPKVAHYLLFASDPQTKGTNTKWSDTVFGYKKGSKFPFGYEFQNLNLRLLYDYACHSIEKVSCTPYTEI